MTKYRIIPNDDDDDDDDDDFEGPGQARNSDPDTAQLAAQFIRAKATSARVKLLAAHARHWNGLTDEEAACYAEVSLSSEYATRCSELKRCGFLIDSGETRQGASGTPRMVRQITPEGQRAMNYRKNYRSD